MTDTRQRSHASLRRTTRLAKKLRSALEERGITQKELALRAGVSQQYVSDLLLSKRGKRLSATIAVQLEDALGVERGFLVLRESKITDHQSVEVRRR